MINVRNLQTDQSVTLDLRHAHIFSIVTGMIIAISTYPNWSIFMNGTCRLCFLAVLSPLMSLQAAAQSNTPTLEPSFQSVDPCRVSVAKFEETIGFIRQSQGTKAAAELKEKLIPAKLENDILFKDGYCGLASYLREKKLTR